METIDDEVAAPRPTSSSGSVKADSRSSSGSTRPTCISARMPKPESLGQAGRWQSPYHDMMIDHDKQVGALLDKLDELGIADNTIVMYSTDNGPHMNSLARAGMTPFRGEKNTNWEGAFRVPAMVRWPGTDPAGQRLERDRPATSTGCRPSSPPPASRTSSRSSRRATRSATRLQGPHRRLRLLALPDRRGSTRARARASSTSPTTATCRRCASTTGSSCSWSSGPPARAGLG